MDRLEEHFRRFRENTVGYLQRFLTPFGMQRLVYADWTASGRLYRPIEQTMLEELGPFVGNTHSELNVTGTSMTQAYQRGQEIIKKHVHAGPDDVLLFAGFGMTAAVNKFQRILGLRVPEQLQPYFFLPEEVKPIVFVTHMEHHSNHTTWHETICDVIVLKPTAEGLVDLDDLRELLHKYRNRRLKLGSFTAFSNVTGVQTPYHEMAKIMHQNGGLCFLDFAASAPYVKIDMHPPDPMEKLDAIFFSPHKFLGGPGTSGVLIFDSRLYHLEHPDQPGGGTVLWTNPWGGYRFKPQIEEREDGGTPGFLQAIKGALAVELKEEMGMEKMERRKEELVQRLFKGMRAIPGLTILADNLEHRLGMMPFYLDHVHYNLAVKLLNDRFGIQARGGCSCAGTYGHYLLHVDQYASKRITDKIDEGDLSIKPGWVRVSIHPTTTDEEADYITDAIQQISAHGAKWGEDYTYDMHANVFKHHGEKGVLEQTIERWFHIS